MTVPLNEKKFVRNFYINGELYVWLVYILINQNLPEFKDDVNEKH